MSPRTSGAIFLTEAHEGAQMGNRRHAEFKMMRGNTARVSANSSKLVELVYTEQWMPRTLPN
jgi:hypothetical protein